MATYPAADGIRINMTSPGTTHNTAIPNVIQEIALASRSAIASPDEGICKS
jgi:hypothetical protein